MAEYSIGDVERMTGVKAHVLRYWEDAIPFIRPRKDTQGRRFYGDADVALLRRIKYLVDEEKYTIEGAGERLLAERIDPARMETRDAIESIRADLLKVKAIIDGRREHCTSRGQSGSREKGKE